mgnify:CR=1 FL=1
MSVKIRLQRRGRKNDPHYKIVVSDSRSPRDGKFINILGHYHPSLTDISRKIVIHFKKGCHFTQMRMDAAQDDLFKLCAKAR